MTVVELPTNGDRRAAAEAEYLASGGSMTIKQFAARAGIKERAAGTATRKLKQRLAANGASPAREELPPRKPAPPAIAPAQRAGTPAAVRKHRLVVATRIAVVGVALVAALLSYSGLRKLAVEAGLGWHADIMPLAVDGLVLVCLFVRTVLPHHRVARAAMWAALAGSVAANAVAYGPWQLPLGHIAAALTGFAPIAAAVCYHLLGSLLREAK